jgi:hypothetical protein
MWTVAFPNIAGKNELAIVIQSYKTSRNWGEILDLENLLSEIMAVSHMRQKRLGLLSKQPC